MPSLYSSPTLVSVSQPKTVAPVYSASITPDASAGAWHTITVTNNTAFTINAPASPPAASRSQELVIEIVNSSGGVLSNLPTWNAAFIQVSAGVFPVGTFANPASTKKRFIKFSWNGTKWVATSMASADY